MRRGQKELCTAGMPGTGRGGGLGFHRVVFTLEADKYIPSAEYNLILVGILFHDFSHAHYGIFADKKLSNMYWNNQYAEAQYLPPWHVR